VPLEAESTQDCIKDMTDTNRFSGDAARPPRPTRRARLPRPTRQARRVEAGGALHGGAARVGRAGRALDPRRGGGRLPRPAAGAADPRRGSDAQRRVRRAVPPLSALATDTRPVAAARRGWPAPLPRGTAQHTRRGAGPRGIPSRRSGARSHCGPRLTPMRMRATGTAQAAGKILYLLQAQSAISFSRARAAGRRRWS
jgi:hypothetical protein